MAPKKIILRLSKGLLILLGVINWVKLGTARTEQVYLFTNPVLKTKTPLLEDGNSNVNDGVGVGRWLGSHRLK